MDVTKQEEAQKIEVGEQQNGSMLWNELSLINNELITMQRTLAKQSAELTLLNRELQQEQEKSQALLAQLEQSNLALQDFASIAAHDLQAPLRKIETFSTYLEMDKASTLSEEGRDYLSRIHKATRHMHAFVTDLLTMSRVSTQAQPVATVDLSDIAREVVSEIEVQIEECAGEVRIGNLPMIEAEPLLMHQLLQNLISNALKFRRAGVSPIISVAARCTASDTIEVTVQDNGIGFDEKHRERIFAPFQRLHGNAQYEGTGMGLAICRKIAERHGGSITAHSAPMQGATFVVTLPVRSSLP